MGLFVGLLLGLGTTLIWTSFWEPLNHENKRNSRSFAQLLYAAGFIGVSPRTFVFASTLLGLICAVIALVITRIPVVGALGGLAGASILLIVARSRANRAQKRRREQWPEVIEHLLSGIRAGMSLPEALMQLGVKGPAEFRTDFLWFARDFRASGRFEESLDTMKDRLADPTADRVFEALRIARTVGGSDLTGLLESLNQFLREDIRTRGELEARQSWTVGGARVAVAAPWLVLLMLTSQEQAAQAFSTGKGVSVIVVGALICVGAYIAMLKLGNLPQEKRVLI